MRTCRSQERYLRPTLYCDPNDPIVIAIADQLGAFKVSDREFAEAAFHFVKERMLLEEMTLNDVGETFQRAREHVSISSPPSSPCAVARELRLATRSSP